jgi:hypothetical protein
MKFLFELQKTLKNGFYIDFFFKNVVFFIYVKFLSKNFLYLIDKYLAEKFFYMLKNFFQFFFFLNNFIKKLSFFNILKFIILITIQLLIIIIL